MDQQTAGNLAIIEAMTLHHLSIGSATIYEEGTLTVEIDGYRFFAGEKYTILELGWAVFVCYDRVSSDWMKLRGETRPRDSDTNELRSGVGMLITSHPVLVALALRAWWHINGIPIATAPDVAIPSFSEAVAEVRNRKILNSFNKSHAGEVPGLARWQDPSP